MIEPAALAFDEPRVAGGGWVEQSDVLVVGLVRVDQPGASPGVDGCGVNAELLGELADGEQTAGAEPLAVAGEAVGAAQFEHDPAGERLAVAGAVCVGVELGGDLSVGVIVEQPVSCASVSGLVCRRCHARGGIGIVRLVVCPPRKRTWRWISSVLFSVTSSISSRAMRLRSRCGVMGSDQSLGKSAASCTDPGLALVGERGVRGGGRVFVLVLGGLERSEFVVPVGLEGVGHEAVVRVDREIAAAGELGVVAGELDVTGAQFVCFAGACFELGLDGQRDLQGERGDGLEQQFADRCVDALPGDPQASGAGVLDALAHALIVGHLDPAALVIADGHPSPAAPADGEALQQCGALAGGAGGALLAVCLGVVGERPQVLLVLLQGEVSRVAVGEQCRPLLARNVLEGDLALGGFAGPSRP